MHASTLGLLLFAALFHALANVLMKLARDKLAFTWWMLGVSSVLGLPLLVYMDPISRAGWLIVIASGLIEAVYFISLSRAYTYGDLSQVYPLARGSAPLFIVIWAGLFLAEKPSALGMVGILAVVGGLYFVNLPSLADWNRPLLGFREPAARWALLTGLLISGYATVDKVGTSYVNPFFYLYLLLLVGWIALAPQWLIPSRRKALVGEITGAAPAQRWLAIVVAAALGMGAYYLVLRALLLDHVGYVGAVREISVVIGAWIGVRFLGERGGPARVLASALVVVGILLIAVYGGEPATTEPGAQPAAPTPGPDS
jgi:drug/metabolite transporter (DMT)-like permease